MADVTHVRPELVAIQPDYDLIEDCCAGERQMKFRGEIYLPVPDPDERDQNKRNNRYKSYLDRAVFTNYTGRTLEGFTGLIFNKDPVVEVPKLCEVVKKNADGSGVNLTQQTKVATQHVIKKGRCGLLIDYPTRSGPVSRAQAENGDVRPVMLVYDPLSVINWDTGTRGSKIYLTLVVLKESYTERDTNDFEVKHKTQYRVLELVNKITDRPERGAISPNAVYRQIIWREGWDAQTGKNNGSWVAGNPEYPRDGKGKSLSEIPFTFIGAITNNTEVDKCPLIDIATVNKAHYRNSADWEESIFIVGQPTLAVTGITADYYKDVYKNRDLRMGSRAGLPLPPNGSAELLQMEPNTAASEGMKLKAEEIVKLGAKIIEQGKVTKTATEDTNDTITENSVLGTIANNVETAFKWGLEWCAIFTGEISQDRDALDDTIKFELNKKFDQSHMTAADRAQLLKEWMADLISKTEARRNLDRAGVLLDKDEVAEKEILTEQDDAIKLETKHNKALAAAGVGNTPKKPGAGSKQATGSKVSV